MMIDEITPNMTLPNLDWIVIRKFTGYEHNTRKVHQNNMKIQE